MKKSDYIIVSLNNNGCAFIRTETKAWETSRENGEAMIRFARENYVEVAYKHHPNGDHQYWFN